MMATNLNRRLISFVFLAAWLTVWAGCGGQKTRARPAGPKIQPKETVAAAQVEKSPRFDLSADKGVREESRGTAQERIPDASMEASESEKMTVVNPPAEGPPRDGADVRAEIKTKKPEEGVPPGGRNGEGPGKKSTEAGKIDLNFDDADLYEVIRIMAELLNINYIVDPNVRGKVTIHTAGKLKRSDLFPVFYQILEVNGLTAIKKGSLYHIVPLKEAPRMPIRSRVDNKGELIEPGERMIIQIIPLEFISAEEMTKLLTPFISADGTIVSHGDSDTLVVVDKAFNMNKVLGLVGVFDVDMFERMHHRVFALKNMDSEEMAKVLTDIFAAFGTAGTQDVKFISIAALNTVLAITSKPQVLPKVEEFINKLDITGEEASPRIYVYYVKNGAAGDLADILSGVFQGGKKEERARAGQLERKDIFAPANPFSQEAIRREEVRKAQETRAKEAAKKEAPSPAAGEGASTLRGEVSITADETRNALIIEAIPSDYRIIQEILDRLDILPRQVLIEATVAEVTLDANTELGVEWNFGGAARGLEGRDSLSIGAGGLAYAIGVADKWNVALKALASEGKVNILSSPSILASENKEARIDVTQEIPLASSQYRYSTAEAVTETSIQYRDTGVILTVTPHINEFGLVTMDVSQEVSEVGSDINVAGQNYPSFTKRTIATSLTVKHGQTLAIGGLIRENVSDSLSGTPCLISMPILRYLTGSSTKTVSKDELIVLITPRVVLNLEDVDQTTNEFKAKVKHAVKAIRGLNR